MSFQNIVVYPEFPDSEDLLSLSAQATVMRSINDASTNVIITKDGELYLTVVGRTLCTILATTQTTITCPIQPGQYSFNYVYPLPTLPAGTYVVSITFNDIASGEALGCVSTTVIVTDSAAGSSCTYKSSLEMVFGTTRLNTNNNSTIGSWIQTGPYGNNAGSVGATFPWGRFVSYQGSTDILDLDIDLTPYVWGLNGTLNSSLPIAGGQTLNAYSGDFIVGYRPYVGASLANVEIISSGRFNFTLNYQQGRVPREIILDSGNLYFSPQYTQPVGFYYPLIFGGLGTFVITPNSDGSLKATAARSWCSCSIDSCGICGGNGRTCGAYIVSTATPRRHGLTDYDLAAIIIGSIAFALLVIVLLLAWMLWRRGREARNVRDDTDLAGPDKPDYGSMAINEVLADHGRPIING